MGKNEFTYKLILDGEVEALKSKIKSVKDSMSGLSSSDFSKSFDGIFKKLEKSFDSHITTFCSWATTVSHFLMFKTRLTSLWTGNVFT